MKREHHNDLEIVAGVAAVPTILQVICRTTGMGFAAVARVTDERWIACAVLDQINFGLDVGGELELKSTICHEIQQCREPVAIDDVEGHPIYSNHHTPARYGFRSYISVPIILADGTMFGTLCAIDPKPARVEAAEVVDMFKLFAELIAAHVNAGRKLIESEAALAASEASLTDERHTAELREQFIAVLGHDLRNPLASIDAGTRLLLRRPLDDDARQIVAMMTQGVMRIASLIDNVLDFARGRLGGGLTLERRRDPAMQQSLEQVIEELRVAFPQRQIDARFELDAPVDADKTRLGQLLSNLLANAITHGREDTPITVRGAVRDGKFSLSVANQGEPIPPEVMTHLFMPYSRGRVRPSQQGLGLGLFIASEIARAHGGRIDVRSDASETRFTFTMPAA